jgi:hypothetical protein
VGNAETFFFLLLIAYYLFITPNEDTEVSDNDLCVVLIQEDQLFYNSHRDGFKVKRYGKQESHH